jgi:hypothetical protein
MIETALWEIEKLHEIATGQCTGSQYAPESRGLGQGWGQSEKGLALGVGVLDLQAISLRYRCSPFSRDGRVCPSPPDGNVRLNLLEPALIRFLYWAGRACVAVCGAARRTVIVHPAVATLVQSRSPFAVR